MTPAFPSTFINRSGANVTVDGSVVPHGHEAHLFGMSLRDYFAAAAVGAGFTDDDTIYGPNGEAPANFSEAVAASAYRIADAMLAERAK